LIGTGEAARDVFCSLTPESVAAKRDALEKVLDQHIEAIRVAGFANFKEQAETVGDDPKENLRREIVESTKGNQAQQTVLIERIAELSEEQVLQLTNDRALLLEWIERE
jgi:hypothetical protein